MTIFLSSGSVFTVHVLIYCLRSNLPSFLSMPCFRRRLLFDARNNSLGLTLLTTKGDFGVSMSYSNNKSRETSKDDLRDPDIRKNASLHSAEFTREYVFPKEMYILHITAATTSPFPDIF